MEPVAEHRDVERERWDVLPVDPAARPRRLAARHGQGLPGAGAALRVLRRLRRLRRDALHPARQPALRRPHDRRQRDGLLVDLRRQPADDAVDGERRWAGSCLEQLPLRGQRRIRPRDAARARRPDRPGPPPARTPRTRGRRRSRHARSSMEPQDTEVDIQRQRERVDSAARRARACRRPEPPTTPGTCMALATDLVRQGVWIIGGDGWAYDIGFGGARPGPLVGPQRQHPGPRYRGLLQYRWPGVEGDAARRRRQVRGRRQGRQPRRTSARSPAPTATSTSPRSPWAPTTPRRSRRSSRPTPGPARRSSSPMHLHRPRHRHVEVHDPPEGRGQERLLAALPVPSDRGRGRHAVQARLVEAVDPDRRLRGDRDPLRDPRSGTHPERAAELASSPRPTPTSAGATTRSSPASNGGSPWASAEPTPESVSAVQDAAAPSRRTTKETTHDRRPDAPATSGWSCARRSSASAAPHNGRARDGAPPRAGRRWRRSSCPRCSRRRSCRGARARAVARAGDRGFAEALDYFPRHRLRSRAPRDRYLRARSGQGASSDSRSSPASTRRSAGGWVRTRGGSRRRARTHWSSTCTTSPRTRAIRRRMEAARSRADPRRPCRVDHPVRGQAQPVLLGTRAFAVAAVAPGADGLVLFNRFYQPDLDLESLEVVQRLELQPAVGDAAARCAGSRSSAPSSSRTSRSRRPRAPTRVATRPRPPCRRGRRDDDLGPAPPRAGARRHGRT